MIHLCFNDFSLSLSLSLSFSLSLPLSLYSLPLDPAFPPILDNNDSAWGRVASKYQECGGAGSCRLSQSLPLSTSVSSVRASAPAPPPPRPIGTSLPVPQPSLFPCTFILCSLIPTHPSWARSFIHVLMRPRTCGEISIGRKSFGYSPCHSMVALR